MREVMSRLERSNHPLWPDDLRPFVRDAYEHSVQVIDMVESLRDLTGGLTDLYMTTLSNRMNEIMKVLTIIGTIFIPLTFVAGIYGMNFERMPELSAPYGYPIALLAMTAIAGVLLVYFRKKGWL
jgi:magnesium transporter